MNKYLDVIICLLNFSTALLELLTKTSRLN